MITLFKQPFLYNLVQWFFSHRKMTRLLSTQLSKAHGKRVLDVGCGTGQAIKFLPQCQYTGFDISSEYLNTAKKLHDSSFNFVLSSIEEFNYDQFVPFDVVLLIGVLHHLNDQQIKTFYQIIKTKMNDDSFLLTVDPCLVQDQRPLAWLLVQLDRGEHIRSINDYKSLHKNLFTSTTCLHCPQNFPPYDRLMQKLTS